MIDLGLPKIDGLELIERLRKECKTYPIIILTARGHWQDKVQGLEAGAGRLLGKTVRDARIASTTQCFNPAGGWLCVAGIGGGSAAIRHIASAGEHQRQGHRP